MSDTVQTSTVEPSPKRGFGARLRNIRWGRWLKRGAISTLVVVIVARLALPFVLPSVVKRVAKAQGLDVRYERLDLSLLTGHIELWNVHVRPLGEDNTVEAEASTRGLLGEDLSHLEFLNVDLDVSDLLTGTLRAHRVEIDGLDIYARRASLAEGWQWEGLPAFQPKETEAEEPDEAEEADQSGPKPFAFDLGFAVDAIRLQHIQLHISDAAQTPAFESKLELNVRVNELGVEEQPTRIEIFAHSAAFLDALSIQAEVKLEGPTANIESTIALNGLRGQSLQPYLQALGLKASSEQVNITCTASIQTESVSDDDMAISIRAGINDVQWTADGKSHARIDEVQIEVPHYSGQTITTKEVAVRGVYAQAKRNDSGQIEFGGMTLVPTGQEPTPKDPVGSDATASPADLNSATEPAAKPLELRIPALVLEDIQMLWQDAAVSPAARVPFALTQARLGPIQRIPGQTPPPIELEVSMVMPGTIEAMGVQGSFQAFAPQQTADIVLSADGVSLAELAPYLQSAGMQSQWSGGSWKANISARTSVDDTGVRLASAELSEVELAGEEQHLRIGELSLEGLRLDSSKALTHIDQIKISGIHGIVSRDQERVWHALGFAFVPPVQGPVTESPGDPQTPSTATPSPASPAGLAPRFELDSLVWEDTHLEIRDSALRNPVVQIFDEVSLRADSIAVGPPLDPSQPEPPAGFELAFSAPDLAKRLALSGTLQNLANQDTPLHLDWAVNISGVGLELTAAEPWLIELGLESHWDGATLQGQIDGSVEQTEEELRAQVDVRHLAFENQSVQWLQLEALSLPEIRVREGYIALEPIEIAGPRMRVERNADGQLTMAGLTMVGAPENPETELAADPISQPVSEPSETNPADTGASTPSATRIDLPALDVKGVALQWIDAAVAPTVDIEIQLDAILRDWTLGVPMEQPGTFEAIARVPGSLDELALAGSVEIDGQRSAFQAELQGRGIRAGSLASYLPPNVEVTLQSGELDWILDAETTPAAEGGLQISVNGQGLRLQESGDPEPVFTWDRLALEVPRADWAGGTVEIAELAVQGVRMDATREIDGSLRALGLRIDPNAEAQPKQAPANAPPAEGVQDPAEALPIAANSGSRRLPKLNPEALPWIRLQALDVGIERLRFVDKNGGEPLDLGIRLHSDDPLTLLSPTPEELEPIELRWSGSALPFVRTIDSRWTLAPYAADPEFDMALELAGIDGTAITRVLPALADRLDGSAWNDGRIAMHATTQLRMRRRGPLAFPFQEGFGVEFDVDEFVLEPNQDSTDGDGEGPELGTFGFDSLNVSVASIRPKTGDVHVKLIDWVGPRAKAWKDSEGLHVAGWVWKPAPEIEEGSADTDASENGEASDVTAIAAETPIEGEAPTDLPETNIATPAEQPGSQLSIDEIFIAGESLEFEDRSVEPAMILPITGWNLEAKRFSSKALQGESPFQFRLSLFGGNVDLPERATGNLVGGLLGSVTALATGNDEFEVEQRPIFDEFLVRGNLSLGTAPKGWVQARVRGIELPVFRGPANAAGVEIGDGLMDESAMVHMDGAGGLRVSSTTRFSYLSLSEPAGGPISTYLKLPAPLDSVLFALKDEDGEQTIPLNVAIGEGGASLGTILGAVSKALGSLIGEALASSPMRILGSVTDLAGLGAKPIELTGEEWVRLPYAPGEMGVPPNLMPEVSPLFELLRKDPTLILVVGQAMGSADIEQASELANPSAELCFELARNYRQQRKDLWNARTKLAEDVRLAYATGERELAAKRTEDLRRLDQDLATTEIALDQVLERTTDRGARAQTRRTKSAALEVVRERQLLVGNALRNQPIPGMATRLDLRRPRFGAVEGEKNGFVLIAVKRRR